jgi:hypothetical protein
MEYPSPYITSTDILRKSDRGGKRGPPVIFSGVEGERSRFALVFDEDPTHLENLANLPSSRIVKPAQTE